MNRGKLSLNEVFKMAERLESTNAILDNNEGQSGAVRLNGVHTASLGDRDRLLFLLAKKLEELRANEMARDQNSNQTHNFEYQGGGKQIPPKIFPKYQSQRNITSSQARFDRSGNRYQHRYYPPVARNYNKLQRHYQTLGENPSERSHIWNSYQHLPPQPIKEDWRGHNTQYAQYPESHIETYTDCPRGPPPWQVAHTNTHRCTKCWKFGLNSCFCNVDIEYQGTHMMRHNSLYSKPHNNRRRNRNKNPADSSGGSARKFLG